MLEFLSEVVTNVLKRKEKCFLGVFEVFKAILTPILVVFDQNLGPNPPLKFQIWPWIRLAFLALPPPLDTDPDYIIILPYLHY